MIITEQQKYFFNTFGYLKIPKVFSSKEISKLKTEFDKSYIEFFNESMMKTFLKAILKQETKMLPAFADNVDYIQNLFYEKGLFDKLPEKLLGKDYRYWGSDASLFSYGTAWHRDTATVAKNIKINLYLNSGSENFGAFRIIPGSHHIGDLYTNYLGKACAWPNVNNEGGMSEANLLPKNYSPSENFLFKKNLKNIFKKKYKKIDLPHHVVPFKKGDLIIFDNRLVHSVFAPRIPKTRRLITLIFVEYPNNSSDTKKHGVCEELRFLKQHECNQYNVNCYSDKMINFVKNKNLEKIIGDFEKIRPQKNLKYSGIHTDQHLDLKKFLTRNYF